MARAKTLKLKAGTNIRLAKEDDTSVTVSCTGTTTEVNNKFKIYDIELTSPASSTNIEFQGTPSPDELIELLEETANSLAVLRVSVPVGEGIKDKQWFYLEEITGFHTQVAVNAYKFVFSHRNFNAMFTSLNSFDLIICEVGWDGTKYTATWTLKEASV